MEETRWVNPIEFNNIMKRQVRECRKNITHLRKHVAGRQWEKAEKYVDGLVPFLPSLTRTSYYNFTKEYLKPSDNLTVHDIMMICWQVKYNLGRLDEAYSLMGEYINPPPEDHGIIPEPDVIAYDFFDPSHRIEAIRNAILAKFKQGKREFAQRLLKSLIDACSRKTSDLFMEKLLDLKAEFIFREDRKTSRSAPFRGIPNPRKGTLFLIQDNDKAYFQFGSKISPPLPGLVKHVAELLMNRMIHDSNLRTDDSTTGFVSFRDIAKSARDVDKDWGATLYDRHPEVYKNRIKNIIQRINRSLRIVAKATVKNDRKLGYRLPQLEGYEIIRLESHQ